jgi:hypothetical protein
VIAVLSVEDVKMSTMAKIAGLSIVVTKKIGAPIAGTIGRGIASPVTISTRHNTQAVTMWKARITVKIATTIIVTIVRTVTNTS